MDLPQSLDNLSDMTSWGCGIVIITLVTIGILKVLESFLDFGGMIVVAAGKLAFSDKNQDNSGKPSASS